MALKGIIIDYSNTLVTNGVIVDEMKEVVKELLQAGIKIAVVSNDNVDKKLLGTLGISTTVTYSDIKKKKPSPEFIYEAAKQLKVKSEELIYLGDDPKTDAVCAANAQILYYHAKWGRGPFKYGVRINSPDALLAIVRTFLLPFRGWGWKFDRQDRKRRNVSVRSVITSNRGSMYDVAKSVFTYKKAKLAEQEFFFHVLVAGITFHSGIRKGQIWTTYPGHDKGSDRNEILHKWLEYFAKEFRCQMEPLLHRHTQANDSSLERWRGGSSSFSDQVNSVSLKPEHEGRIDGKTVVVLDDFTTSGKSLEWARNLLYEAGAEEVIGITLGKISQTQEVYTPKKTFKPFQPCTLTSSDFDCDSYSIAPTAEADSFDNAFKAWTQWHEGDASVTILVNPRK